MYELLNVQIASYSVNGSAAEEIPVESLVLIFEKITYLE